MLAGTLSRGTTRSPNFYATLKQLRDAPVMFGTSPVQQTPALDSYALLRYASEPVMKFERPNLRPTPEWIIARTSFAPLPKPTINAGLEERPEARTDAGSNSLFASVRRALTSLTAPAPSRPAWMLPLPVLPRLSYEMA